MAHKNTSIKRGAGLHILISCGAALFALTSTSNNSFAEETPQAVDTQSVSAQDQPPPTKPVVETKDEFQQRLKKGVIRLDNGDVFIVMKPRINVETLPSALSIKENDDNFKGSGFGSTERIFLLNLDPNLDVLQYLKDIKSTNRLWINASKQYFKRKRLKFEEVRPAIRSVKPYIDSGAIIFAPLHTGQKTMMALLDRLEKRNSENDINSWVKTLKTIKPVFNLDDVMDYVMRISFIAGYNEKSKEFLVYFNEGKDSAWITEAELIKLSKERTHYSLDVK